MVAACGARADGSRRRRARDPLVPESRMWSLEIEAQRRLARLTNDYFMERVRERPDRFGLFASLPPLTDTAGALAEIERAFGLLHADGVRVMTSYEDRWLGDAAFEPVWADLDRRGAVVFVHPDTAACCRNLGNVPAGNDEYPLDTGAAQPLEMAFSRDILASLRLSWRRARVEGILVIAGGTLPRFRQHAAVSGWTEDDSAAPIQVGPHRFKGRVAQPAIFVAGHHANPVSVKKPKARSISASAPAVSVNGGRLANSPNRSGVRGHAP